MTIKKFVFFALIITIIIFLFRKESINILNKYFFEKSFMYDRGHWLKNDNLYPNVVFLGTSMTRHTIIPDIIAKNSGLKVGDVVNLGMNAATPYEMYLTFKKNIDNFKNTKLVFYNIDPAIFSKAYYNSKKYEKVLWSREEWEKYSVDKGFKNYFYYKTTLFKELLKNDSYERPKFEDFGYLSLKCTNKYEYETKIGIEKFFKEIIDDGNHAISYFQLEYLKKLKKLVENNNSTFIILYVPNQESFTKNMNEFNYEYNKALEKRLNEYLGDTIQYGTYCPNILKLDNSLDFSNSYHLCHNSAQKYSNYLGNIFEIMKLEPMKIKINYNCK